MIIYPNELCDEILRKVLFFLKDKGIDKVSWIKLQQMINVIFNAKRKIINYKDIKEILCKDGQIAKYRRKISKLKEPEDVIFLGDKIEDSIIISITVTFDEFWGRHYVIISFS